MAAKKQPQDHLAPADERLKAVLDTRPKALEDQFEVDRDLGLLIFHPRRGGTLKFEIDPDLDTLDRALSLEGEAMDSTNSREAIKLLVDMAGEDARHIRASELQPVFERWSWEMAILTNGVTLPESEGSAAA